MFDERWDAKGHPWMCSVQGENIVPRQGLCPNWPDQLRISHSLMRSELVGHDKPSVAGICGKRKAEATGDKGSLHALFKGHKNIISSS